MSLEVAYARARDILGPEAECFEVAEQVEDLRSVWRPQKVRVVLLAESHVWTSREEARSRIAQPNGVEAGFARFVYCLGYGEPEIVTPPVKPNAGTPQYWRLFHDSVYEPTRGSHASVLKARNKNTTDRLRYKFDLLTSMRERGIWLVDASITALYHQGRNLAGGRYSEVLKASWDHYIRDLLLKHAPSKVLIVGKGVESVIGYEVRGCLGHGSEVTVINQPNARMSMEQIMKERRFCFEFCSRHSDDEGARPL